MVRKSILLAGGVCSLALMGATPVLAQAVEASQVDDIVVTGTNIRGAQATGSVVQVIGQEQLAESGKATLADLIRELPGNFAGGVGQGDNSQGGQQTGPSGANLTGGQGANLRGLGALSTLVLVNGRRVAAAGQFGDFVDISNIPASAIERVEILQDGASAVYGSDAVGGVINFILKRGGDGLTTTARVGTTTQGGGTEGQASATWGRSWDRAELFVGYEYARRDRVSSSDRDIYNGGDLSDRGGVNWPYFAARAGRAANLFSGAAVTNGAVAYTVPGGAGTGLTLSQLIAVPAGGSGNTYNPWEMVDILPETERHSLFATFDFALNDRASLFGDARYTHREGSYNNGYTALFGTLPTSSPFYIPGVGTAAGNNFGVLIDDRPLIRDVSVDSLAINLGGHLELVGDWRAEASLSYSLDSQNRYETTLRNANIDDRIAGSGAMASTTVQAPNSIICSLMGRTSANPGTTPDQRFCAGLGYQAFNPYTTDPLSEAVLDQLIGYQDLTYDSWVTQATLKADGTVMELPGGPLKLAVGIDWRRENISGNLDFNFRSIRPLNVPYGTTERDTSAAFAEFAIPLVGPNNAMPGIRALAVSAAIRYEESSGLGDYDSVDPKVGIRYTPVDGLNIRATWGTSFHAPPMRLAYNGPQPVQGGNAIQLLTNNANYTAPCNTALVRLNGQVGTPGAATGNCSYSALLVAGGAGPTLQPETAETWTLGFDTNPSFLPSLRLGASYFNLQVDDRIQNITAGTIAGILSSYFATGSSPYLANFNFSPTEAQAAALMADPRYLGPSGTSTVQTPSQIAAIINATSMNIASLRMDGIDFNASYDFEKDWGTISLFANGSWVMNYETKAAPNQPFVDNRGQYSAVSNPVSLRSRHGVSLERGPFKGSLSANYVGSYECSTGCFIPNATTGAPMAQTSKVLIDSWTTFDLYVGYDLSGVGSFGQDSTLSLTVVNVGDQTPPFVNGGTTLADPTADPYDAANATVIGRTVALTWTKRW